MSDSAPNQVDLTARDDTTAKLRRGSQRRHDPNEPTAVVGLGASAGGVAVLQQFFGDMPPNSGLAFVVVMHLSPEHESNLAAVLQQKTSMPVMQVAEPIQVKPNHVYVIPPNHQLTFEDDKLRLVAPQQAVGRRVTIDLFFRTLAQAYGQRSVCAVLSGSDSDGAIGVKHIRAQGGITIAQDPNEAEHDSMPLTAISTGMIDWVLPVAQMPAKLLEFVRNEHAMQLPSEIPEADGPDVKVQDAAGGETVSEETRSPEDEAALVDVLAHLQAQTSHDFQHYKRATVLRRIARRLQVNSIASIPEYLEFMRTRAPETRALLQDMLIGVTHFFRDQDSFAALQAHLPQLFAGKTKDDQVRVWVAGCATGEEAYSVAMLLCEHAERLDSPPSIQIFASDIDEQAIQEGREGLYPATIEADVSQERLRRFFQTDHGRYRVRKGLREKVLFSSHNLLHNPPFSRIDLITCRNLLIYLNEKAQEQVFDIFHFALRSGGLLFVGSSESSAVQGLFSPVDAKHRIFVRRSVPRPTWKLPALPLRAAEPTHVQAGARVRALPTLGRSTLQEAGMLTDRAHFAGQERRAALFGELHLKLLEQYAPPSVVVSEEHDIVHLSEKAGRYLRFAAGEPSMNLFRVINPALQIELRTALFRASQGEEVTVTSAPQTVQLDGPREVITMQVRRIESAPSERYFLVIFEGRSDLAPSVTGSAGADEVTRGLDDEINYLKKQLSATVEEHEAAAEELKASNEELQAANEELRSATEELETSKEELQSVNEELTTVNAELKSSVEDLGRANADLNNLIASTEIGTIFLNRELRIQRFTPSVQQIFNLLPADLNRPLSDITHNLHYTGLMEDARKVLNDWQTIEREVRMGEEKWLLARLAPYRTSEDRIAGVVATFVDITRLRGVTDELGASELRFRAMFEQASVGIKQMAHDGTLLAANPGFCEFIGYTEKELKRMSIRDITHPEDYVREEELTRELAAGVIQEFTLEKRYRRKDGEIVWGSITAKFVRTEGGLPLYTLAIVRAIGDRKQAEEDLRASEERFRQFAENSTDTLWIINAETRELEYLSPAYERMWGEPRDTVMQDLAHWVEAIHPEDRARTLATVERLLAGETLTRDYRIIRQNDGAVCWIRDVGFAIRDDDGRVVRIAGIAQDITADKERAEQLGNAEERFRLLVEGARDYAMFLLDPANIITFWSKGAERVFGWSREEATGQNGKMIFTPEDRASGEAQKEIDTALLHGRAPDRRFHLRKDGSRFWADGVLMRLNDESGGLRGFAKVARDATEQKEAEDALLHARDEMEQRVVERTADLVAANNKLNRTMAERAQLERELLTISEREKRRIGEDLHDMICQELTATALFLKSSAKQLEKESPAAALTLHESAQIVNHNVGFARDMARGLHPMELKASGLPAALRSMAAQISEAKGIKCEVNAARLVRTGSDELALHLFRMAQEAVTNAVKHSNGKNIIISLYRRPGNICLNVEDDGKGMPKKQKRSGGLGIHILNYRANLLGATLEIGPRPGGGTKLAICAPTAKSVKQ